MSDLAALIAADAATQMRTYARAPVAFVRGEGTTLVDGDGNRYLDLLAGIAVASLGHCHPAVVAAIREQAGILDHVSNLYLTEPQLALAERLTTLAGFESRVFFANSGAEANECALKLARRVSVQRHGAARTKVVALRDGFHGRTFATLAATGQPGKHAGFEPLPAWFTHVEPNDVAALTAAIDETTAAVLLEVVQGEGGVRPLDDAFLIAARQRCTEVGALLILDEVQTGIGRLGAWFGFQTTPIVPDVLTVAKALGGGLPIGACIARTEVAAAFAPGDHATTFGGGPIPCAAGLAVLQAIEDEQLLRNATERGAQLAAGLARLEDPRIVAVRGRGLLQGLVLSRPVANAIVEATRAQGVVIGTAGGDVVRFAPPLIVTAAEIDRAVATLDGVLQEVS